METIMEYGALSRSWIFVGKKGAEVSVCDADGKFLVTEGKSGGRYAAKDWLPFVPAGGSLYLSGDAGALLVESGRVVRSAYGKGANETAANPDFRGGTTDPLVRQMMTRFERLERRSKRDAKALAYMERKLMENEREVEVIEEAETEVPDVEIVAEERPAEKD